MSKVYNSEVDPRPLMIALAKMAHIEASNIRRMVLVLDCDDLPRLYVETFLEKGKLELPDTELEVAKGPLNTTVMHNEQFRSYAPRPEIKQ